MFFIVKVRIWSGPGAFSDENIVKVAGPSQLLVFFSPSGLARGEISFNLEKKPLLAVRLSLVFVPAAGAHSHSLRNAPKP
ncbi:hypothetical protein [Paenibacillus eucommiae]|uniref:Uncharacterized protein n=1 Tax=Paenibacillus eucommiae TaxID=1355755 RepID=A0ABS4J1U7_9BACL|nr:hypothetical protein [Paenibacillus eucommiae]MBP1993792.1 hypothetical protein [Paenibacillus eucommiae]